jgi:hypothetical protein
VATARRDVSYTEVESSEADLERREMADRYGDT